VFFAQASRGEVLADVGLTDPNIARQITGWVAALGTPAAEREVSQRLD
jgi:1-deoxy-D-xylulose-5-phosphate synthase